MLMRREEISRKFNRSSSLIFAHSNRTRGAALGGSGKARTASTALVSGESAQIRGSTLCDFPWGGRARGAWVTLGWRECHGPGE